MRPDVGRRPGTVGSVLLALLAPLSCHADSWLVPSSARVPGAGGAFYTTDLFIANSGASEETVALKFLGHDVDGREGPEQSLSLSAGGSVHLPDVLGSLFGLTEGYGAIRVSSLSGSLVISARTSTPAAPGGTYGQSVPAFPEGDWIGPGSARTVPAVREDAEFRTNLVLTNTTEVPVDVDVLLVGDSGLLAGKGRWSLPPLGMAQVSRVVRAVGLTSDVRAGRLLLATPTPGGAFVAYAAAIDNATNDPLTLLPMPSSFAEFLTYTEPPSQVEVTVEAGSGGGSFAPGEAIHVWADPPGPDEVFAGWAGDTGILADSREWHTTATVPSRPAAIRATYRPSPAWTTTTWTLSGSDPDAPDAVKLIYHVPPNPVGIVYCFHGAGGSASGWSDKVESRAFLRDAVAAGYGFAALDSRDRVNREWDPDPSRDNLDVLAVEVAIGHLSALGLITPQTPRLAVGMSNGGGFVPKVSYWLGFQGTAVFCAGGSPPEAFEVTNVPTIWCLQRNDDLYDHTDFLPKATANQAALARRGVPNVLHENGPSPVYPQRFTRVPGLTAEDSRAIHDTLLEGGYLAASGEPLADPETSGWEAVVPARFAPYRREILEQLDCCYSGHRFFSDLDGEVLRFFDAARSSASRALAAGR